MSKKKRESLFSEKRTWHFCVTFPVLMLPLKENIFNFSFHLTIKSVAFKCRITRNQNTKLLRPDCGRRKTQRVRFSLFPLFPPRSLNDILCLSVMVTSRVGGQLWLIVVIIVISLKHHQHKHQTITIIRDTLQQLQSSSYKHSLWTSILLK